MKDIRCQLIEKYGSIEAAEAILAQGLHGVGMPEGQAEEMAGFVIEELGGGMSFDAIRVLSDFGMLGIKDG